MKRFVVTSIFLSSFLFNVFADDVAVFPVVGINADKSYIDAFGMLLAKKYETISGQTVIDPIRSARALGSDSNYQVAAEKLGVSEYIELTAIGLFVSRKEKHAYLNGDSANGRVVVVVNNKDNDDNDDEDDDDDNGTSDDDQKLLDNHKTVVTAIRRDHTGNLIYKAELTLVTYGDIEEASDRFATALFHKITVEEARSLTNITRREGMGQNKLFAEKISGFKVGVYQPFMQDGYLTGFTTLGYNMRMESAKYFVEFGVNARIPGALSDNSKRKYGGVAPEVGASYIFTPGAVGVYAGGGVIPFFNFAALAEEGLQVGLAPYLQAGVTFPRNSRTRFYVDFRVAQNVLPITTGSNMETYDYTTYESVVVLPAKISRPFEIGANIGIGW